MATIKKDGLSNMAISALLNRYLEAVGQTNASRGRGKRTVEWMQARLLKVEEELKTDMRPLERLRLYNERLQLTNDLDVSTDEVQMEELRQNFIKYGPQYSERHAISYHAWRAMGVPPADLKEAGITR